MGTMVNTGWRDRRVRWSMQVLDIDGYDGQYRLEISMGTIVNTGCERSIGLMVNTGWRDRWLRWSIQVGDIDGYDCQYRLDISMGTMVNTSCRDRWVQCTHKRYVLMGRNQLLQRIST